MKQTEKARPSYRQGMIDALPITISIVLFGAIFGMLCLQVGLTPWQSVAMSLMVYAGSAQFTALSMLGEQASLWAIVLATFLLNSRHFLMGLSMSVHYQRFSAKQTNLLAFFLTDEQYAITLNRFRHHRSDIGYIVAVSLLLYTAWSVGTLIGTLAGRWIPDPDSLGLGFSFTAMFIALAYYQLTSALRIFTFFLCGTAAVALAQVLPNGLHLLAAGIVAFLIGYLVPQTKTDTADEEQQVEEGIA
ncbi:AzlC family ABC transporter permease [Brevibacillus humidisoli]|uniref:AzlC family ABC transporter permease n=1 Tax=Brevibacillus humidisoli TaxID=2895522 RepID=UPI001E4567CD|nr:AzlC family ABC transporter permease [Brevibacillus humidisoli]UFJ41685.1 AzlC family ABC transporter permease [Brevibacillus humidisoli]